MSLSLTKIEKNEYQYNRSSSIADIPDDVTMHLLFLYFDEINEHSLSYSIDDERLY